MIDYDAWQEIFHTISRNKVRSLLTAFGVFWGIFMLVVMAGSGIGLENGMTAGVKNFASNSLFMFTNRTTVPYKGFRKGRVWNLKNDDLTMLKDNFKQIDRISGIVFGWPNGDNVVRGDKSGSYSIKGVHPDYLAIDPVELVHGRFINDIDIQEKRKVCVLSEKAYNDLYLRGENPVGSMIKINGIYYTVIGSSVALSDDINVGAPPSETIIMPFSTLQQSLHLGPEVHSIGLTAKENIPISTIEKSITDMIREAHQIAPDDANALFAFNAEKTFKTFQNLGVGITILIWIVGLGTLFAGVIGVSNIMLITIKERTQEIGIRRALGATPRQIIAQIMSESLVLTTIAGMMGIVCGVGLLALADSILTANATSERLFFEHPQITFTIAIASAIILIICGLLAGLLPSYRALQIKAIDALRDE